MKDLLYRLTRSSVDPEKMALTAKAVIVGAVPTIIALVPFVCSAHIVCLDPSSVVPFADLVIGVIQGVATAAAAAMLVFGLLRKLFSGQWTAA